MPCDAVLLFGGCWRLQRFDCLWLRPEHQGMFWDFAAVFAWCTVKFLVHYIVCLSADSGASFAAAARSAWLERGCPLRLQLRFRQWMWRWRLSSTECGCCDWGVYIFISILFYFYILHLTCLYWSVKQEVEGNVVFFLFDLFRVLLRRWGCSWPHLCGLYLLLVPIWNTHKYKDL